jgi:putative intracellular protease/amidase
MDAPAELGDHRVHEEAGVNAARQRRDERCTSALPASHRTQLISMQAGSNFSQSIVPTHTFKHPPKDLEVLIVPGGLGSRAPPPALLDAVAYIKDVYPRLRYIISVCTGATLLARAGVLDGRRATTNKHAWAWAVTTGPNVTWVPAARWVVDGNVWTTSGVAVRAACAWSARR